MDTLSTLFAAIDYRDPIWIAVAYLLGFVASLIGLPPLVGFLFAGFTLTWFGASGGAFLSEMADLGVTLLLFTIGLKLNVRQLLRPDVWGVATAHMMAMSFGVAALIWLLAGFGLTMLADLTPATALLLAFALSFSSTVFAVKVFEDKGGMGAQYGRVAIAVLIVQDIAAVVFLAASTQKLPSPWALVLLAGLFAARPALIWLLKRAGHGELLILLGLVLALGGSGLFEFVGLKGDLGALFFGVLLAQHSKAGELAKSLMTLKDLFLVGFFLSIGMSVTLSTETVLMSLILVLAVPAKGLLFFLLFTRFRMRTRQATFAALSLSNFSEFGLIVTAIATGNGWLGEQWLVVMALAVVLSFILASPLNAFQSEIYQRLKPWLVRLESHKRLPGDEQVSVAPARVLICGMGRIGGGAYHRLVEDYGVDGVAGIDFDEKKFELHSNAGRKIIVGDSSNPDFWQRLNDSPDSFERVLLCMPNHSANRHTAEALRAWGYKGFIAAVMKYAEEEAPLRKAGVDWTFDLYAEVGYDFARDILERPAPTGM
ncbi:cation:proton antiporter [Granulosicoccaceae sp. 1_MG-2023]|nr:cation:proton antiporter [Granulosicoccaceae sp. 1_MG-2023]